MTSHHKPPPRKHHPPVKVHRFPLYRKLQPVVEEVQKEKEMDKEKEKEETVAPEPVWSAWEQIKGPQWDGYWRAKNDEDGKIYAPSKYKIVFITKDRVAKREGS